MKIKTLIYSALIASTLSVTGISTVAAQSTNAQMTAPINETQGEVKCSVGSDGWKCEIVIQF